MCLLVAQRKQVLIIVAIISKNNVASSKRHIRDRCRLKFYDNVATTHHPDCHLCRRPAAAGCA